MIKLKLGPHKVTLYNDIEALPIERFQKYNKMLMLDAGLGSDVKVFDSKLARINEFIQNNDIANASTEIDNIRQTLFNVQNGLSPYFMSLIPLMSEIDGEPFTDLSDASIQAAYDKLKDVTLREYKNVSEGVKKKIEKDLDSYFHQGGPSAESKEYYELIRRRALLMCDEMAKDEDHKEEIDELTKQMVRFGKPMVFNGDRNREVLYDKNFIGNCISIAQNLNMDAKQMTVLEYYRAIEVLEEQQKELKRKR